MSINTLAARSAATSIALASRVFLLCAGLLGSGSAGADWKLDSAASSITFATVKNGSVEETHRFKRFTGSVSDSGNAQVTIDLLSADTGIEIRDQRMQEMLFGPGQEARIRTEFNVGNYRNMPEQWVAKVNPELTLELNSKVNQIPAALLFKALAGGDYQVESQSAVVIDVADYGFTQGIEKLRSIAGLNAISTEVKVSFSLKFIKE